MMTPKELGDALTAGQAITECSLWSEAWREILRQYPQPDCFMYFKRVVQRMLKSQQEVHENAIRAKCMACSGTGHGDADSECEYCGRPIRAIRETRKL